MSLLLKSSYIAQPTYKAFFTYYCFFYCNFCGFFGAQETQAKRKDFSGQIIQEISLLGVKKLQKSPEVSSLICASATILPPKVPRPISPTGFAMNHFSWSAAGPTRFLFFFVLSEFCEAERAYRVPDELKISFFQRPLFALCIFYLTYLCLFFFLLIFFRFNCWMRWKRRRHRTAHRSRSFWKLIEKRFRAIWIN